MQKHLSTKTGGGIKAMFPVYVIFTPDSVRRLFWCPLSFAAHSSLQLVLVSNGLKGPEAGMLHQLSEVVPHWRILDYPTSRMLPHGTILQSILDHHHAHNQKQFAFMDSDIVCFQSVDNWLQEQVDKTDVFSSCTIAKNASDQVRVGLGGQATQSPSGEAVAASYFCIYRLKMLLHVQQQYAITLERYNRLRQIPGALQSLIPDEDRAEMPFDTGKLISWCISRDGGQVVHQRHPDLEHLGGMSKDYQGGNQKRPMRRNHAAIQRYLNHVLEAPGDAELKLDAQWKKDNVQATAQRLKQLKRQLREQFPQIVEALAWT